MPLVYADFAHHYEGQELNEDQRRVHFDAMADLLECIARLLWGERDSANPLGISFDGDSLQIAHALPSERFSVTDIFKSAAANEVARKEEI